MSDGLDTISETDPLVTDDSPPSVGGGGNGGRRNYGTRQDSFVNADFRTYLSLVQQDTTNSDQYHPMDNPITVALQRCNDRVLKPYRRLLLLVGWEPWFDDPINCWQKIVNIISPLIVMLFVVNGYVIQYAACFRRDSAGGAEPWIKNPNISNSSGCQSVLISQYIIPDLLHSVAYVYSFYLLRVAQSEQLTTLIERVFLQTSPTQSGFLSQGRLIRVMGGLLFICVAWILLSLAAQVIHVIAVYQSLDFSFLQTSASAGNVMLVLMMLLSFVFLDIVYTAVVINFCVQCSLLTFYIEGLQEKLRQKLIDLPRGIKEISEIETYLRSLNYTTALALSIVLFNFGTMAILGAVQLLRQDNHFDAMMYLSTTLSVIFWLSIMALPIFQAARLSAACNSLRKIGHTLRVKPFIYQDVPDQELDAFLLFTSSLNLRAKIFMIPVKTSYLTGILVSISFIMLLLFQTETIRIWL